jgi:putative hydrolase of HD superfamily
MDDKIFYLIQQAGSLMNMPRSHKKNLGTTFDTVASHSFHVAVIAYCIARMEGLDNNRAMKATLMGLFHDLAEARTGDVDFIGKHYTSVDEEKAIKDQFDIKDFGEDLKDLLEEYKERTSLEAKCAKDADSLEQTYQVWVLSWQGNKIATKWFESGYKDRIPGLRTESAKKLAYKMKDSSPQDWWWSQFMKDDAAIDKEKLIGKR